jgi:PAS domain S-box/diguanylate cyclase (GGDEF) domain
MTPFARLRIRSKLGLVVTLLLATVSMAVFLYFPAKMKQQAIDAVAQKAAAISEMEALSVAPGLDQNDRVVVAGAVASLRHNPDLVYFVLLDQHGDVFASFNDLVATASDYQALARNLAAASPSRIALAAREHGRAPSGTISDDESTYSVATPVVLRGRRVGTLVAGFSLQQVWRDTDRSRATIALVTLLAFTLGTAAVFAISTLITSQLKRIVRAAESIGAGALTTRVDAGGGDEVGQLARGFNLMLDRLAVAQQDLETLNRTLEQRVEERALQLGAATEERRKAQESYRLLFDRNLAGVYIATEEEGRILTCNDACARMFRYESREELLEAAGTIAYMNPRDRDSIMRRLRSDGAILNEEVELRACTGESVWAIENIRLIPGESGAGSTLEGILLDTTDRKRGEREIAFKAYHDSLTGLPNRALLLDRMEVALAQAQRTGQHPAVIFIDLDDLKTVNDTLGHALGDEVLRLFAARLTETLREGDTVARVGGDEFVILLPDAENTAAAEVVAQKILMSSIQALVIEDEELHVTCSLGIAIHPDDGLNADDLLHAADSAMYRVKQAGGSNYEFSNQTGIRSMGRLSLESELRQAVNRDELVLHFQPQVLIDGRELCGAEALVRWQHPERSLVEPAGFIAVAEQTGLIAAIGEIVLRKACQQGVDWSRAGLICPRISVNVSPRQFYQRDFVGTVERILVDTGFDPRSLELEITESVALQKSDRSIRQLKKLRGMGIRIAIDDFGTGQSSLSYLKDFLVDTVKIDKSFVSGIATSNNDQSIVTAVLLLANELGLRTIAEGVETEEQAAFLKKRGCAELQGFLISYPLPAEFFQGMFMQHPIGELESAE